MSFASPNGPLKLNQKHILAAALYACGATQLEICNVVGLSQTHMSLLCSSQLFQAEVSRYRDKLLDASLGQAVSMLLGESMKNVQTLTAIRDNEKLSPHVRLRAASDMLDRVAATSKTSKIQQVGNGSAALSQETVEYLVNALDDDPVARKAFKEASQRSMIDLTAIDESTFEELPSSDLEEHF